MIKRLDDIRGMVERYVIFLHKTTTTSKITKSNQNSGWEVGVNKKLSKKGIVGIQRKSKKWHALRRKCNKNVLLDSAVNSIL